MELFEYIKSQLPQMPNVAIMKDMGASDELVEYVKESPENTNLNVMAMYGCEPSGGTDGEPWFVGTIDPSAECQDDRRTVMLSPTSSADIPALKSDPEGYSVKMNEMELPILENDCNTPEDCTITWFETEDAVHGFIYANIGSEVIGAYVPCDWTGEVKVYVTKK